MTNPTPEPARAEPVGGFRDEYGEIKHMRAWPAERDRTPDATALSRALSMHDTLPDEFRPSDNEPLRNCLPGIWPTVGDLRAVLALAPASDAGLAEVERLVIDLCLEVREVEALLHWGRRLEAGDLSEPLRKRGVARDAVLSAFAALRATIATLRAERDCLRADAAGRGEVTAELRKLSERATPGLWSSEPWAGDRYVEDERRWIYADGHNIADDITKPDGALIAAAVNDLRARIAAAPAPATDGTGGGL